MIDKKEEQSRLPSEPDPQDGEETVHKGLCVNCAHRHYCLFPRAEGGIWHCEEYEVER